VPFPFAQTYQVGSLKSLNNRIGGTRRYAFIYVLSDRHKKSANGLRAVCLHPLDIV